MINFEEFLETLFEKKEKKEKKPKAFNINDAKGKLYEILLGSHLHSKGKADDNNVPAEILKHYRDEEGKSPKQIHDAIKEELDKRDPKMYNEIANHAFEGYQHIKDQLAAHGHNKLGSTAWTSQAGDHGRFTKDVLGERIDDPNSDADVMVHTENGPIGLSLKYGSTKNMNLRNPGLETLEKNVGLRPNELDELRKKHSEYVGNLGIRNHDHFKELLKDPNSADIVNKAMKSANDTQNAIAKKVADGLTARTNEPDFLKNYIKHTVAPVTNYQHFRLHTRPDKKGGSSHHMSDMQDDAAKLDNYEDFQVEPHDGKTITVKIKARRKGSNSPHKTIFNQRIARGSSGPMKGFRGVTTAPYITAKDEEKGPLKLPPKKPKTPQAAKRKSMIGHNNPPGPIEDPRMSAMSTDGGREPNQGFAAGHHNPQRGAKLF